MPSSANGVNGVNSARNAPQTNGTQSAWQAKHNTHSHFIGGNQLNKAPPSKVKDFVQENDGHSVITSVCLKERWSSRRSCTEHDLGAYC